MHARGRSDRDAVLRDIVKDNGVCANDGPTADGHARPHEDILAKPCSVPDLDGTNVPHALIEDRNRGIAEGVTVVRDVNVARHQHLAADADRTDGG